MNRGEATKEMACINDICTHVVVATMAAVSKSWIHKRMVRTVSFIVDSDK